MAGLGAPHGLLDLCSAAGSSSTVTNSQRSSALRGDVDAASQARFLYPKLKSTSHDKAQWLKWHQQETQWQSQHIETTHRTMKKSDSTRSHSWWWDSHVSPKNSRWLQENLSEMDSKLNAMLKIIEEDADSFAQRAEMYYKKRPELIILVEEFYRTYRALVERYTFLTREIRQNIAPALQAQLGVSPESAQNSPIDLQLKRGIDGFDIVSPSYSYTVASEFDYDSPSEVSTKGHTDEEELSPLGFGTNYETRSFGLKPKFPSLEEENVHRSSEFGGLHGTADMDISQLQKDLRRLQDENKVLVTKSSEDVTKLKNLQLEVSSLQSKLRSQEAEDKLTKKRLKSIQEQEQKLEAENLKLSHALIISKEEKTDLVEQCNKEIEKSKAACQRNQQLEDEIVALKQESLTAQSHALERLEHIKKGEEANERLQQALTTVEEERQRYSLVLKENFEQQSQELQQKFFATEEENVSLRKQNVADAAEIKKLEDQLTNLINGRNDLEQLFLDSKKEKKVSEHEKSVALSKIQELQGDLEVSQKDRQSLSEQMAQQAGQIVRLNETISKLEEERTRLEAAKVESSKYVLKLEGDIEEGQRARERLMADCQQYDDRCKALGVAETQLNDKLVLSYLENARLQDQKSTFEEMVAKAGWQVKELQQNLSSLSSEKTMLMEDREKALEQIKNNEALCAQMHDTMRGKQGEINKLEEELTTWSAHIKKLENSMSCSSKEKDALEKRLTEALQLLSQLEKERGQLRQVLEMECALTKDLKDKVSSLENERTELALEIQQMQQKFVALQGYNTVLSNHYTRSQADHQAAQETARKAQDDLAFHLSELKKLQEEDCAKTELLHKINNEVESLENRLAKSKEENSLIGEENEKCNGKLADFEAQINDLKTRLSDSMIANLALTEQAFEKGRRVETLNAELLDVRNKNIALNEDIALRAGHALGLQDQLHTLKEQGEFLHAELQKSSERRQSLEADVEKLQQEDLKAKEANESLVHEQQRLLDEILLMKKNNQDLEANLSQIKGERVLLLEEATARLEQCHDMQQRIKSLEGNYEAVQSESDSLRKQVAKSEEEKKVLEEQKATCIKKLSEAQARVQDLELRLSNFLIENSALADQVSNKVRSIDSLEAELFDLQKDNTTLNEDVSLLREQISALKYRENSLLAELHKSSDVTRIFNAEVERLQQMVSRAEEINMSFVHEQQKNLDENLSMKRKIQDLQEDLCLLAEEKVRLTNDITTHLERCNELELEIRSLAAEKDEERKQLSGTLDSQKKKLQKQEEDLQSLQQALSCSQKEQGTIMDKLNLIAGEKDVLERKYADLQEELKESKHEALQVMDKLLKLETDLSQLQQVNSATEGDLSNKVEESRKLQEDALIWQAVKLELEKKLQLGSSQAKAHETEVKTLQKMLADVQQQYKRLDEMSLQSVADYKGAQKTIMEVSEERDKQRENNEMIKQELAVVVAARRELEQELAESQEEKTTLNKKMETVQQELNGLQEEQERLLLNVKAGILHLREKEMMILNLQEQLNSADSYKLYMAEKQSKMIYDWGAAEKRLQEEIAQLKSENLQNRNDLMFQHGCVIKLEDVVCSLQAERKALQDDKALAVNQITDLQQQTEGLKTQHQKQHEEGLKLLAQSECLQQSLLSTEQESANLKDLLQTNKDCHSAAEEKLKNEISCLQSEVVSKAALIAELYDTLSGLERKKATLVEEMTVKEQLGLELQKEANSLRVENKELTHKLQSRAAEIVRLKSDLKTFQEVEMHELHDRLMKLQNENKSIETSHEGQAAKNALLGEQIKELTSAISKLQEENTMLKTKLATQSTELDNLERALLVKEGQTGELQQLLVKVKEENKEMKKQTHIATEEGSQLKADIENLQLQIQSACEQHQQEHEKHNASVAELNYLHKELEVTREENNYLRGMVSVGAASSAKLQEEISSLHNNKRDLEDAVDSLNCQLKDSQLMVNNVQKMKEALWHELQRHSRGFFQMMSEIEDLNGMLANNQNRSLAPVRHESVLSQEEPLENPQKQFFQWKEKVQSLKLAEQIPSSEIICDEVMTGEKEPILSSEILPEDTRLQDESLSPKAPMEILGHESKSFCLEGVVTARIDAIHKLKENAFILLEENDLLRSQSLAASIEHNVLENSVEELQSKLSHLQEEYEHILLEVYLYKKEINSLKEILEGKSGEETHEEAESAHVEVKKLRSMLYNLQERTADLEEESRGFRKEAKIANAEVRKLQVMLSDLQGKGITYALLLKENLLSSYEEIKLVAEEWQKEFGNKGSGQIIENLNLPKVTTSSSNIIEDERIMLDEEGEGSLGKADRRSLEEKTAQQEVANSLVLLQLQERVKEVFVLREAVGNLRLRLHNYWREQCKEQQESLLSTTAKELNGSEHETAETVPMEESLLIKKQQGSLPMELELEPSRSEHDTEVTVPTEDQQGPLVRTTAKELMQEEYEALERGSIKGEEQVELIEGLARLHINLGMRLHQALMDEKLENELLELKEERKQLKEDLQARVEQVQRMEAELGKLQRLLKEGNEEDRVMDPRQQQQWLQKKEKAEERASNLLEELVLQRQQVGKMQEVVMSWAEQQEVATESLEEQVLVLVSKESAPTMEGWDDEQVNQLMKEMQSRKALTRRHSLELQSVGQELRKVSSSIESTQQQLLVREEEEEEDEDQDRIVEAISVDTASSSINSNRKKPRGFGLAWFLYLFSPEKKGRFRRSRSNRTMATPTPFNPIPRSSSTSTPMSTLVAQTRKKVGSWTNRLKSFDDK